MAGAELRLGSGSEWLSRRPPGRHEHDQSSSAFIDTPTSRHIQSQTRNVSSQSQPYATPSLVRPSTSKLYQDLTRGIAASRRAKPNSRISTASSGWGSPKMGARMGGRESSMHLDSSIAGPSKFPRKVSAGVFDTPRTPSGEHVSLLLPRAPGPQLGANGSAVPNVINQDGSFSVVRDEGDANNSGLLGMSPAVRRINGLGLGMTPATRQTNGNPLSSPAPLNGAGIPAGRASTEGSSTQGNQTVIEHSSFLEASAGKGDMEAMRARLLQVDGWDAPPSEDRSAFLDLMRNWREDAMKHHLYDTAIFWGDKILSLESERRLPEQRCVCLLTQTRPIHSAANCLERCVQSGHCLLFDTSVCAGREPAVHPFAPGEEADSSGAGRIHRGSRGPGGRGKYTAAE